MRKLLIVTLCGVFLFCGCSKNKEPVYKIDETKVVASGSAQSVSDDSTFTSSPEPTPTVEPTPSIKYDKNFRDNVVKEVKKYTYMDISQTIETKNFNSDETEGRTEQSLLLNVKVDSRNLILYMDSDLGLGENSESSLSVRSDLKNKIFYEREGSGEWEKSTKGGKVFKGFSDKNLKDLYFVYKTLVDVPENEVVGSVNGDLNIFKVQREAKKDDLSADSRYDKLLTTEIIHTYKGYTPVSIEKATNFTLNNRTYTVSTTITINELSRKALSNLKKGVK